MEQFIAQLKKLKKGVDFEHETKLFDDGYLKSFDIIQIISMMDREYGIAVPPSQILPDNFNSAQAMWDMMQRLED